MLRPAEIRALCERKYPAYLRSRVTGEAFFPLQIPFGRPATNEEWATLQGEVQALENSKSEYRIEWEEIRTRRWGLQRLPQRVWVDDEGAYLRMLNRGSEAKAFGQLVDRTRGTLPELLPWLAKHADKSLECMDAWPDILKVCTYFLANPRPNLYARELPISVDTKFVERYRGILRSLLDHLLPDTARTEHSDFDLRFGLRFDEPQIQLRLLDPQLKSRLGLCFDTLAVPVSQLAACDWHGLTILIVENQMTFLTLPQCTATVGLFGRGAAAELLTSLKWLSANRILYWGDLDTHGLHILSRLRRAFPHIEPLLMDVATLESFRTLCVPSKPCSYEEIAQLTAAETGLYRLLRNENVLLEQEKLPHAHVLQAIAVRLNSAAQHMEKGRELSYTEPSGNDESD